MHVATGFRVVDTLYTIATGQRELVSGDGQKPILPFLGINQLPKSL